MIASLLALACAASVQDWTPPPSPPLVPAPALSQPRFAPFVVPTSLRVVTSEEGLEPLAAVVAESLGRLLGRRVPVGLPPSRSGDVVLTLGYLADEVSASPEALSIEVFDDHVALSGATPAGVARAAARLLQLFEHDETGGTWSLPPVRIDDAPNYAWRAIQVEPPCSAEFAKELVEIGFLASFNAVIVRGVESGAEWPAELQPFAAARGIRLSAEPAHPAPASLAYIPADSYETEALKASGPWAYPVLCESGQVLDLERLVADRCKLIDARSAPLRIAAGQRTDGARPASVYGWNPELLLVDGQSDLRKEGASLVVGSHVVLAAGTGRTIDDLLPVLPHFSERMWGSQTAPETLAEFTPRADAFLRVVDALRMAAPH